MPESPPLSPDLEAAWTAVQDAHLSVLDAVERLYRAGRSYAYVYAASQVEQQARQRFDTSDCGDSNSQPDAPATQSERAAAVEHAVQEFSESCVVKR